jgi:hypothetical protein
MDSLFTGSVQSWLAVAAATLSPLIALIVGFEGVRQASRAAIELPTAKSATTLLRLLSSGDATRLPSTQYSPDACEEFAQTERLGHIVIGRTTRSRKLPSVIVGCEVETQPIEPKNLYDGHRHPPGPLGHALRPTLWASEPYWSTCRHAVGQLDTYG